MTRQEKNYRLFSYFNKRRLDNGRTIISIMTLEKKCEVPKYTIQHLVNLRRLITEEKIDIVLEVLSEQYGLDLNRKLSKEEEFEMSLHELFN